MPFDLTTLLGCTVRDARVCELSEYFEESPAATERDKELGGRYYLQFFHSGFSLLLNGTDVVETAHIFTNPHFDYQVCTGTLPFDLDSRTTQAEARDLFGPPTIAGGPFTISCLRRKFAIGIVGITGSIAFI
jgi:hypothetical protein